jgi:hypothetical protein
MPNVALWGRLLFEEAIDRSRRRREDRRGDDIPNHNEPADPEVTQFWVR